MLTILTAAVAAAFLSPRETFALPQPQNVLPQPKNDFSDKYTMEEAYDFEGYDAKVYVLKHDKTGAKVELILNDDPTGYFMLEFETPSKDNKGTAHVFEHSAMNGSVKYPSRSLFPAIKNRTYTTYINAFTKEACTIFPVASPSEKQLLALADYYADSCFEPMILEDEDIFRSEAWRLEIDDTDERLRVDGTIYTEMCSKYTADIAAIRAAMGLLYHDCATSFEPGGIPQDILTLSYDEVKEFHSKYYRPSNCTAYLYGDIKDPGAFLDLLDDYFVKFDNGSAKDKKIGEDKAVSFPSGYVEMKYDFPSPDANGGINDSVLVFAIDLGRPDDDTLVKLYSFAKCCDLENSTPKTILRSMFPDTDLSFTILPDAGNAVMNISAKNIDGSMAPLFRTSVLAIMSDIAGQGLPDEELKYFKTRMETDAALAGEGENAVMDLLMSISNYHSGGRNELFYLKMRDRMLDMDWFNNNVIKAVASDHFADPARSAMSIVTPDAKAFAENEEKLEASLKKMYSSMSDKDREKLSKATKRIVEKASDDPTECLNRLNVVKVSDLQNNSKNTEISDKTDDKGTRHITVYSDTDGIDATVFYFDVSSVPSDMLGYLALYTDLVNGCFVPAGSCGREDLPYMISGCTAKGQDISLVTSTSGDDFCPYVAVRFSSTSESNKEAYELAYKRLFESVFDDPAMIKEGIAAIRNNVANNIINNPELVACYSAGCAKGFEYYGYTHYLEYYDFLTKLEENIGEDHKDICEKLSSVAKYFNNSNGLIIGSVIPKKDEDAYEKCADDLAAKLEDRETKPVSFDLGDDRDHPLGIITAGRVVSNAVTVDATDVIEYSDDPVTVVALSIMTDRYLRPVTRGAYGAYSCSFMDMYPSISLFTGKDPTVKETFDVMSHLSDAWKKITGELTQEELDGYIITAYASQTASKGDINEAMMMISDMVAKEDVKSREKRLEDLKDLKLEDLGKYDALFEKMSENGKRVSVGSSNLIKKNADTFADIINQFAK